MELIDELQKYYVERQKPETKEHGAWFPLEEGQKQVKLIYEDGSPHSGSS